MARFRSGSGSWLDDVAGSDRRGGLEQPEVVVGVFVRSEPGELDVEDAQPVVIETFVDSFDHRPIAGQRDDVLARRYRGGAQAGEVVAGAGGDLDLLEWCTSQHGEVGE